MGAANLIVRDSSHPPNNGGQVLAKELDTSNGSATTRMLFSTVRLGRESGSTRAEGTSLSSKLEPIVVGNGFHRGAGGRYAHMNWEGESPTASGVRRKTKFFDRSQHARFLFRSGPRFVFVVFVSR